MTQGYKIGDRITYTGVPPLWKKLLIWLKIIKPRKLNMFVVSVSDENTYKIGKQS